MTVDKIKIIVENKMRDIEFIIEKVSERGCHDIYLEADDYSELRQKREYKDLIIGEFYETYFLPQRHEFDWNIVSQIVELITSPDAVKFIELSIAGGLAGGAAYDLMKTTILKVLELIKNSDLPESHRKPYALMSSDLNKIRKYFKNHESSRINEIEKSIGIPRERIYPFLKILGFIHQRRTNSCLWCKPEVG